MSTTDLRQPHILGVGAVVPDHILPQDTVKITAQRILGPRYPEFERLSQTFLSSGIEQRYSVAPFEWFEEPKNWPERTKTYLEGATTPVYSSCGKSSRRERP